MPTGGVLLRDTLVPLFKNLIADLGEIGTAWFIFNMKLLRDSIILCNTVSCLNVYLPCSDTNENVCEYYRFNNVTRSTESALNGGFNESIRELELESNVTNICGNVDEEWTEVDEFENSSKKVRTFEESLLIPNGADSNDSLFYLIYNAIYFLKSGKTKKCSDGEIEEVIDSDSYRQSNIEEEYLQLDLKIYIFKLMKYY